MADWFRSWHGAPTDAKWLLIGRKTGIAPALVSAVVWALFDHASQQMERGSVATFDPESYAAWAGMAEDDVRAIIAALIEKGLIVDGRLASWEKRQPKREDHSTERSRAFRERQKRFTQDATLGNAVQRDATHGNARVEESREEEIAAAIPLAIPPAHAHEDDTPAGAPPTSPAAAAVRETAEILRQAPWVTDSLSEITRKVNRSFRVTTDFRARDGPALAEKFTNRREYRRKPPDDWYSVWLTWLKTERSKTESVAGAINGRASVEGKVPPGYDVIYVDGVPHDREELDRR